MQAVTEGINNFGNSLGKFFHECESQQHVPTRPASLKIFHKQDDHTYEPVPTGFTFLGDTQPMPQVPAGLEKYATYEDALREWREKAEEREKQFKKDQREKAAKGELKRLPVVKLPPRRK